MLFSHKAILAIPTIIGRLAKNLTTETPYRFSTVLWFYYFYEVRFVKNIFEIQI